MLARIKARRREYAECQLVFSKVMLVNVVKQGGKYNVRIGNEGQVSFLFCPESLGGNIKGELVI